MASAGVDAAFPTFLVLIFYFTREREDLELMAKAFMTNLTADEAQFLLALYADFLRQNGSVQFPGLQRKLAGVVIRAAAFDEAGEWPR